MEDSVNAQRAMLEDAAWRSQANGHAQKMWSWSSVREGHVLPRVRLAWCAVVVTLSGWVGIEMELGQERLTIWVSLLVGQLSTH